ncbi:MAG: 3D domain-containing protein [Clostridiaceae bacterium]|nr:3D domain-containing protein [Clostridiaceae bacterium]
MKKISFTILMCLIISNIFPTYISADDLQNSKDQLSQVSSKLSELNNELKQTEKQIFSLNESIKNNEDKIEETNAEIKANEKEILSLQKDIDQSNELLSKRLREMYKTDAYKGTTYLEFLFKSTSLNDFFSRVNACDVIIKKDENAINEIKDKVSELNSVTDEINTKKDKLLALNDSIKTDLSKVKEKEASLNQLKKELTEEQSKLTSVIEENENKLVSHSISIINSNNSSINELTSSVENLKGLLPQISTSSVIKKVNDAIATGEDKINKLKASNPEVSTNLNQSPIDLAKKTLTLEATAYYGGTLTCTGTIPVRIPGGLSTVAVDPNVIPLGSKVYVDGYGYAVAADTGGDIKGNRIDLYMNSSDDCYAFGRRSVTVYIIAYPNEW